MMKTLCFSSLFFALLSLNFSTSANAAPCGDGGGSWGVSIGSPRAIAGFGQTCSFTTFGPMCALGLVCVNTGYNPFGFGICTTPYGGGRWGGHHGGGWGGHHGGGWGGHRGGGWGHH